MCQNMTHEQEVMAYGNQLGLIFTLHHLAYNSLIQSLFYEQFNLLERSLRALFGWKPKFCFLKGYNFSQI
jgi:hypothetical protein